MSDWFVTRALHEQELRKPRCYGVSSNALALYGIGVGPRPVTPGWSCSPGGHSWRGEECGNRYPHDEADLGACELTYEMAPADVQARMLPVLDEFRQWVREGLNRYGAPHPYQHLEAERRPALSPSSGAA